MALDQKVRNIISELPEFEGKALTNFFQVKHVLETACDETGIKMLDDLAEHAGQYNRAKATHEYWVKRTDIRETGEDMFDLKKALDKLEEVGKARKSSHEALISSLYPANRYAIAKYVIHPNTKLPEMPRNGLWPHDPHAMKDREAVGGWATSLANGLAAYELALQWSSKKGNI